LQAALATVYDDLVEHGRARVDEAAKALSLPEGTDSSDHISGNAFRLLRIRKLSLLGACRWCNRLEIQAGVGWNDRTNEFAGIECNDKVVKTVDGLRPSAWAA
jgi:hypothetical protein